MRCACPVPSPDIVSVRCSDRPIGSVSRDLHAKGPFEVPAVIDGEASGEVTYNPIPDGLARVGQNKVVHIDQNIAHPVMLLAPVVNEQAGVNDALRASEIHEDASQKS